MSWTVPFFGTKFGRIKGYIKLVSSHFIQEKTMKGAFICELNSIKLNMGIIKALRQLSH